MLTCKTWAESQDKARANRVVCGRVIEQDKDREMFYEKMLGAGVELSGRALV
jgi:hypothetical protein